ncbi:hypothetical protein CKAH01_09486 [Colletotrichum kahawae]|uniref:Uncharacterized protein n=1 Tax=Colletotrichum kahawae TaxID=34407 RepID=A0AAD9Y0B9_COLKA|nr:hypothetical protein CKAH01_09486 [Colletotrichum kahawae]
MTVVGATHEPEADPSTAVLCCCFRLTFEPQVRASSAPPGPSALPRRRCCRSRAQVPRPKPTMRRIDHSSSWQPYYRLSVPLSPSNGCLLTTRHHRWCFETKVTPVIFLRCRRQDLRPPLPQLLIRLHDSGRSI